LRALQREQEVLYRAKIADTATTRLPTTGAMHPVARNTGVMLPLDAMTRPYVRVVAPSVDTMRLITLAVEKFHAVQQCYPAVILLSPFRYLTYGESMGYYYPKNARRIPYAYEPGADYDVLVRGGGTSK
jgi:hypothetical protein